MYFCVYSVFCAQYHAFGQKVYLSIVKTFV